MRHCSKIAPARSLVRVKVIPALAVLAASCASTPPPPSGPGAPSPDSRPACANATVTPEMREQLLAEYRTRQLEQASRPIPPLPGAAVARPIRDGAMPKHECFVEIARRGDIDLLFVGDSITDFFGRGDRGQPAWNRYYGERKAANFGISGDTTQDVLWRMQNGELEGFKARAIVLMLGTNNIRRNDNADIAAGDAAIIAEFRKHQPQAKVLLLGIFPRGNPASPDRAIVSEINGHLENLADNQHIFYLDIGDRFLNADGSFVDGAMADGVHPAAPGYEIWAAAIEPTLSAWID
jgi:lysophospholipase L1-like esterase